VTERIDSQNDALSMIDLKTGAREWLTLAPALRISASGRQTAAK
jgi:hypothetical protein